MLNMVIMVWVIGYFQTSEYGDYGMGNWLFSDVKSPQPIMKAM